jgi:plasmid stabilization system protein ParE
MQLIVSPQARDDLREAYRFVAADNSKAAERLLTRILEVIGLLTSGAVQRRRATLRDGREGVGCRRG